MPTQVTSAKRRDSVIIRFKAYDKSDLLRDADDNVALQIVIGHMVVDSATMTRVGVGTYEYVWDTRERAPGVYRFIVECTVDGVFEHKEMQFKLEA